MRSFEDPSKNRIDATLRAARRRRALVFVVEQSALAIALVLVGAILLLLLGTQILAWYWLAILAAFGMVPALLSPRARAIPSYRLAQILDYRLKLSDSLSTAWFLLSQSRTDEPVARLQIAGAVKLASTVRVSAAFPVRGRPRWIAASALAVVAISLFGVRYLVTNTLSLKPALVSMRFGTVLEAFEKPFAAERARGSHSKPLSRSQSSLDQKDSADSSSKTLEPNALRNSGGEGNAAFENSTPLSDDAQKADGKQAGTSGVGSMRRPETLGKASQDSVQDSERASMQQDDAGLLGRMKDAFSSLMAKMRPNGKSQQSASNSERSGEAQRSSAQSAIQKDQPEMQQKLQGDQSGGQQSAAGKAQAETAEITQTSKAQNASGSSDRQGSAKQSGIGRQDGDKQIKEAEQLRAMGKLAEIIGKRSANLTGDMTVETSSHNQALQTQYSQRLGRHSDSGGVIDRDEVPLAYEQYVRGYMQAVRKQAETQRRPE